MTGPRALPGLALALLAIISPGTAIARDAPVAGYGVTIDARTLIGPPPAPGSAAAAADRAAMAKAGAASPAKWREAQLQGSFRSKQAVAQLSCAFGRRISPQTTPATARILARANADMSPAINAAKGFYKRDRPFVGNSAIETCDPRTRDAVAPGSGGALGFAWPSGHAAYGELASRLLAQVAPERATALRAWGASLGDNRVVCRVHWPSDVAAGRRVGDAFFAVMKDNPAAKADIAAARKELESAPLAIAC